MGAVAIATIFANDGAGNAVSHGGASVIFTTTGGTSVVTVGPTTDRGTARTARSYPVSAGLTFAIDASNADSAKSFGGKDCPASALTLWTDLGPMAFPGTLTSFPAPPCAADSGWQGTGAPESPYRLTFNGVDDYVNFGAVDSIQQQTVLAWIRETDPGTPSAISGGGGLVDVVPVVTKGTNEQENDAVDVNFYIGIASSGALASDYEMSPDSANAPFTGSTVLAMNAWYMVGMTLDVVAGTRRLWVNGAVDASTVPMRAPSTGSASQLVIGGSRATTGATSGQGRSKGDVAAVMTYDRALSATEIEQTCHSLSSRFGMTTCPN